MGHRQANEFTLFRAEVTGYVSTEKTDEWAEENVPPIEAAIEAGLSKVIEDLTREFPEVRWELS